MKAEDLTIQMQFTVHLYHKRIRSNNDLVRRFSSVGRAPVTYTEAISPLQLVAGSNPASDPLLRVIPPSLCPLSCLLFSCPI